jgi:hypothetical protein
MQHAHGKKDATTTVGYGDDFDQITINLHFRRWFGPGCRA